MTVIKINSVEATSFKDVEWEDSFVYIGNLYVKTNRVGVGYNCFCVNLAKPDDLYSFNPVTKVARLVVELEK